MTGLPEFNYPAFNAAAEELRAAGFDVLNPAEGPERDGWQAYMRAAVALLVQADGVALLPGWYRSRGASIERTLAGSLDMPAYPVEAWLEGLAPR